MALPWQIESNRGWNSDCGTYDNRCERLPLQIKCTRKFHKFGYAAVVVL